MGIHGIEYETNYLKNQSTSLSDEQKTKMTEILSGYHPETISPGAQTDMWAELKAAGIPRSREVIHALEKAGFTISTPPADGRFSGSSNIQNEQLVTPRILDLFKQRDSGDISEAEFHSEIERLKQHLANPTGNLLDHSA